MPRRIVFVNRYYWPDMSATSQMLTDLATGLAGDGWDVAVVTGRQLYDEPDARLPARERRDGVLIHRLRTTRFGRARLAGRALDYLSFYLLALLRLLAAVRRGDVLVAMTDPPLLSLLALPVAAAKGARLVNWVQDLFPEVAEALGLAALPAPVSRALRRLRNASFRRAAVNVVLGDRMARLLREEGVPEARIAVIHNWSDGAAIVPRAADANPLRTEWGLDGAFVVGYSGNMGRAHSFHAILEAASRLRDDPRIAFLFVGGGARRAEVEAEVKRRSLRNVTFHPYQPRQSLPLSLTLPDVHLVCLKPALEGLIVPSKFYGAAAAERPVVFIGDTDGEIANMVRRWDCGCVVGEGEGERLANCLASLAADPGLCRRMGAAARAAFLGAYDEPLALARWRALLRQL